MTAVWEATTARRDARPGGARPGAIRAGWILSVGLGLSQLVGCGDDSGAAQRFGAATGGVLGGGGISAGTGALLGTGGGLAGTGGVVAGTGGSLFGSPGGGDPVCGAPPPCAVRTGNGCETEPLAPGSPCDDGDPNTTGDRCDGAGTCAGTADAATGGQATGGTGGITGTGGAAGPAPVCPPTTMPITAPLSTPPYGGTAFIATDLLRPTDPSAFVELSYGGQGVRAVFDRRTGSWGDQNMHLWSVVFGPQTRRTIEFRVNAEFSQAQAETHAREYGHAVGQLPAFLLRDVQEVTIHAGTEPFGGGNGGLLIHTGQGDDYRAGNSLEEILIHEAAHTSVDADHSDASGWRAAQSADGVSVSTYGRDYPNREDVAETIGAYLPYRYGADRVPASLRETVGGAIPNRIAYLDCQGFSMDPLP